MKIKTSELTGAALALAVAKARGFPDGIPSNLLGVEVSGWGHRKIEWRPDVRWDQGGPIIEREGINIFKYNKLEESDADVWCAHKVVPRPNMEGSYNMVVIAPDGPTPLIAAMRCFVASKLGDGVDVPEELMQ